ncbi:hypothetical protein HY967_04595 [Candidatus Jorgensenbacteria bacterium]|nr:hypothetical protein [Candidatus Jorgensenbacteria bacterium]
MSEENHNCQNCKKNFVIEPEDFEFYKKIQVLAPTFCPRCRLQRRLAFKNERTLYKRNCDLCKKDIIAIFPSDVPFPVYCPPCWFSDKWDAESYGVTYDPTRNFFPQFHDLMKRVPKVGLYIDWQRTVNSEYLHLTGPMKDCYLLFLAEDTENCMYSYGLFHSKDTVDCTKVLHSTESYELVNCHNCYHTLFSVDCRNCVNVYFSRNLNNCTDCFGCVNLVGKKNCIWNKQHTEEDYKKEINKLLSGSFRDFDYYKKQSRETWLKYPNKFIHGHSNNNVSGDYIYNSKNVQHSFEVIGGEDNKYCHVINMQPTNNCYDYGDWGKNASFMYESVNCGEDISNTRFSYGTWIGKEMDYCDVSIEGDNLFGCISLRRKGYCILNKRYSKGEYLSLRDRIIKDMNQNPYIDKRGRVYRYGEFFPIELSPYPYYDTAANDLFSLSKEEIISEGYRWRDSEKREYAATCKATDLPNTIQEVKDSILHEVIECAHKGNCNDRCTIAFRIVPQELAFYRKMNIPLPHLCHNCRHYERFKFMNPPQLWDRHCACSGFQSKGGVYSNTISHFHGDKECPNRFKTSYSLVRSEIVYCEQCYNAEVI